MRRIAGVTMIGVFITAFGGGCAQNPFTAQQAGQQPQIQQQQVANRTLELQNQLAKSDRANQELEAFVAQTRQQSRLYEDQTAALREQLNNATAQLAQLRDDKTLVEQRAQAITASVRKGGNTAFISNNSVKQHISQLNLPGLEVRQDGDVVRIELPAEKMFDPGTARLRNGANLIIENAALEIARVFANQIIGIEGYTDADPLQGSNWISNHQLSLAQATAVFEYVSTRMRIRPEQLFVAGHGGNHPVVSNATLIGKARNRRVELVIYPEQPTR